MNKLISVLSLFIVTYFIAVPTSIAAYYKGTMTLNLFGAIDINANPSEVQYIRGYLSGTTSFDGSPVYTSTEGKRWAEQLALIALSKDDYRCNSSFLSPIPGQNNKYGVELSSVNGGSAYLIPILNYSVTLINFVSDNFGNYYFGQFFSKNDLLLDRYGEQDICFTPKNRSTTVPTGGAKKIVITSPGSFPIYITPGLTPGILSYKGTPIHVATFGESMIANSYLILNVTTDIMIRRTCSVTGVSAQQFNENMTLTDELTRNSTFTVSCGGTGNPVNISATIKEGSYESGQPTKLLLAPINGTVSDEKPWVLGMPYRQGQEPSLTCNDAGRSGLIKFDNTNVELSGVNMGNDKEESMGIKWALCKTPQVKAGDYRAKVDISIFVRG